MADLDKILNEFMNKACDYEAGLKVDLDKSFEETVAKINRLIVEARRDEIKQLAIEGVKRGGFETINNLQNYLGERLQALSNNLSKGDGDV